MPYLRQNTRLTCNRSLNPESQADLAQGFANLRAVGAAV
jgi:hypothetical protein